MIRLALFEPEIPHNTGTLLRLAACWGFEVDIIHPCGFALSDRHLRRAGMDYIDLRRVQQYENVSTFLQTQQTLGRQIILATPHAPVAYHHLTFQANDTLVMGRESTGFPESLQALIQDQIMIPMHPHKRSINLALAAGIILGEALRQLNSLPL